MKIILRIIIFSILTIITQIGGVIYLLSILLIKRKNRKHKLKRVITFITLYTVTTFLIVPNIAPYFGRKKITESSIIQSHSFFYNLTNRNYVRPQLNKIIKNIAEELAAKHPGIKLIYLDANFPFYNKFPLLPHLSHNDGKKIDISLIYKDPTGKLTNNKPSFSGYGAYAAPTNSEYNQIKTCKNRGNWQYDFSKYLTFGTTNKDILFSKKATADLVKIIVKQREVGKLFIEPHLKNRMHLKSKKIRYHGCQAVRHDDHIHFQLK